MSLSWNIQDYVIPGATTLWTKQIFVEDKQFSTDNYFCLKNRYNKYCE